MQTQQPLVSIIAPTYNHEKYIEKCMQSAIDQSYQNWEMLIVDDGSTDRTAQIIQLYLAKDARIKYFFQPNKGLYRLGEMYNFALNQSEGQFIAILEGDDYWHPTKLKSQIAAFESEPDLVMCWGRVNVWQDDKKHILDYPRNFNPSKIGYYSNQPKGNIFNMFFEDFPIPLSWLINRKYLVQIEGFQQVPEMPTVDLLTLLRLSRLGKFKYMDEALGVYRKQAQQATNVLVVQIAEGKGKIIFDYYNSLSSDEKHVIKLSEAKIKEKLAESVLISLSKHGRAMLALKQYKLARKSYMKALGIPGTISIGWRVRSLIGIVASYLHCDVEGLAKMLGKT